MSHIDKDNDHKFDKDHENDKDYENNLNSEFSGEVDDAFGDSEQGSSESSLENLKNIDDAEQKNITELEQKVTELKDLYVRSQAEIQNIQRRNQEEIKKARDYAIGSFARDVVIVKDYLEMALKDQSGNIDTIKTGVDLTLKQLIQVFEKQKIKEIEPKPCDKLDPHLHQAMNSVEAPEQDTNTIVSVMQKGYILNERILRPAMVVVAK